MPGAGGSYFATGGPALALSMFVQKQAPPRYTISGVTYNAAGAVLGGCAVEVFTSENPPRLVGAAVSDPATGAYSVDVPGPTAIGTPSDGEVPDVTLTFQAVAYLPGSPDVAGVTVNTLLGQ
jgi:hypothetical protein